VLSPHIFTNHISLSGTIGLICGLLTIYTNVRRPGLQIVTYFLYSTNAVFPPAPTLLW
jgi:hypothetical protein